ncbi:MAG: ribonuclease H-like domain-containing protein, partial [Acetatifactor sp.]|nr:ribonuclease H-like domain-containing protein [Acetatifactor sp.]
MKTDDAKIENLEINYPLENLAPLEQILFLDIETTGFTARTSYLYLIGCAYYSEGSWYTRQWFAQSYVEEIQILTAFFEFAASYKYLIHFNGNNFDLPYLLQKCEMHKLPY